MKQYLCINDYSYPGFCHFKTGEIYEHLSGRELRFDRRVSVNFTKFSFKQHFKLISFKYGK